MAGVEGLQVLSSPLVAETRLDRWDGLGRLGVMDWMERKGGRNHE